MHPVRRHGYNGYTLLEVLIALVVLMLGVLGVLAVLMVTLRGAQQVDAEAVAFHLATDMADQLRGAAGPLAVLLAQFEFDASSGPADQQNGGGSGTCFGMTASCSTAQLAAFRMDEWRSRIQSRLPGARVRICRDTAPWHTGSNALTWSCTAGSTGNAPLWIKIGWQDRLAGESITAAVLPQLAMHAD